MSNSVGYVVRLDSGTSYIIILRDCSFLTQKNEQRMTECVNYGYESKNKCVLIVAS